MEENPAGNRTYEGGERKDSLRRVNWWGIFGLLCGVGSAYLSLRILFEALTLLGNGP